MKGYSKQDARGRFCPVMGSAISRETCASERGSQIDCLPDCPGNPFGFANYKKFRNVEARWFEKAVQRVKGMAHSLPRFPFTSETDPLHELMEVHWVMSTLLGHGPLATGSRSNVGRRILASLSNDGALDRIP
jgi:hypothetical protein